MKIAITIFFVLCSVSFGADDFNWSWEKSAAVPSEKIAAGAALTGGVQSAAVPGSAVRAVKTSPPVQVNRAGSVPDSSDRAPTAAPGTAAVTGEGFSWAWEKDRPKTATGNTADQTNRSAGISIPPVPAVDPLKTGRPAETVPVPPEIEDLSGAVPKSSIEPSVPVVQPAVAPAARPNPPSQPVVRPASLPPVQVPQPASVVKTETVTSGSSAYDELVQENTNLKKKITETRQDKDVVRLENERLAREVKDLEQRIAESSTQIKDIGRQKESLGSTPARRIELETRLVQAEQERVLFANQLSLLQKQMAGQGHEPGARPVAAAVSIPVAGGPAESVKPGSDLYRKIENENLLLRQKHAELDDDRQKAIRERNETQKREELAMEEARRAQEAQKQMKEKLEEVRSSDKRQKKMMIDLAERIPDMEKEVDILQKQLSDKEAAIREKDTNLEIMASEVRQRENRIRKAEKMVELMEQAQKDVSQVSDVEKRDMHYNMAAVYAQVGRFRDAEREYLNALRLDPADADVHYNLGILYDENLNEKPKAAMHYRRYLKLRPNGSDVDAVKNWLMNIDMR